MSHVFYALSTRTGRGQATQNVNFMKHLSLLLCGAVLLFSGCKYDDDDLWNKVDDQEERIAALEQWQQNVNSNITTLQNLVSALENNDYITGITEFDSPEPGGYRITFSKSKEVVIWHGADSPVIGVAEHPAGSGKYHWTLDEEFIEVDGQKMPATGQAPQMRINTSTDYWEVSYDFGKSWKSLGVKATGSSGSQGDAIFAKDGIEDKSDYYEFTLANGKKIQVGKYFLLDIMFQQPGKFTANQTLFIPYELSAGVPAGTTVQTNIYPTDPWYVVVDEANNRLKVTAPQTFTIDNFKSEVVITVTNGTQSETATLYLNGKFTGQKNEPGGYYYEDGELTGMVIKPSTAGDGLIINVQFPQQQTWSRPATQINAMDLNSGQNNWNTITTGSYYQYNSSWEWIRDLGAGWYPPAENEILDLLNDSTTAELIRLFYGITPDMWEWSQFICGWNFNTPTSNPAQTRNQLRARVLMYNMISPDSWAGSTGTYANQETVNYLDNFIQLAVRKF